MTTSARTDFAKNKLKEAMVQLLKSKPFDQISTIELVKTAGISRSAFYNYYKDKNDMIDDYQKALFSTIQYVFDKNDGNLQATMLETFEFLARNDIYAALLSENSNKEIHFFIRQQLINLLTQSVYPHDEKRRELGKLGEIYATTYYAHAIFGLTQAWILRNRQESPAQMTNLLLALIS